MKDNMDNDTVPSPSEGAQEQLPPYTPSEAAGSHNRDDGNVSDSGSTTGPRDRRAAYAMQIQRACKQALQRVKENNILASSEWAEPLTAAPTAISVMAFLMKIAADKKIAGMTIASTEVKDATGNLTVGTLPSNYFHTNLMHCSDIGRLAFLDAQKRMNKINSIANTMMEDGGKISFIVELLEDAEDAKDNLKPEMMVIKKKAAECGDHVQEIQKKFEYWHLVINHLSTTALDLRSEKLQQQQHVHQNMDKTEKERREYDSQREQALVEIEHKRRLLHKAQDAVNRAVDDLDNIRSLPPIEEPSYSQDVYNAEMLTEREELAPVEHGFISDFVTSFFGASSSRHQRNTEHRDAHYDRHQERLKTHIANEKARREAVKREAKERLAIAKDEEERLRKEFYAATYAVSDSEKRLVQAKANLAHASANLARLDTQKLELTDIIEILRQSTSELNKLKKQLERLVNFFSDVETNISEKALGEVESFIGIIERNTKTEGDAEVFKAGKTIKKKILSAALQIQGQFSAIADISTAYVRISDNWIREAIDRMQMLALVKDEDWDRERATFDTWCQDAIDGIDATTREASANMETRMAKRIGMLRTLAIEAAEDNDN